MATTAQKTAARRSLHTMLQRPEKTLQWYFRLGQHVETIHPIEEGRDYGEGVMRELALELGRSGSFVATLLMARRFAKEYTVKQVEKLDSSGKVSWSHVQLLLSLEKPERLRFQRQCVKEGWSARELHRRLKEFRGRAGQGGRRHERPESLEETLRRLVTETEVWRRRYERVWFSEDGVIRNAGRSATRNADTRKLLDEAVAALEGIQEALPGDLERLRELRGRPGRRRHE